MKADEVVPWLLNATQIAIMDNVSMTMNASCLLAYDQNVTNVSSSVITITAAKLHKYYNNQLVTAIICREHNINIYHLNHLWMTVIIKGLYTLHLASEW